MLEKLEAELKLAISALNRANSALEATEEAKHLKKCKEDVELIQEKLKAETLRAEKLQIEKIKQEIIDAGFEVRKDHKTSATNHHDRTSDNGEPYTYLIVHKNRPEIKYVSETSHDTYYTDINDTAFDADWVLGYGENWEEAWKDAIYTWRFEEARATALAY